MNLILATEDPEKDESERPAVAVHLHHFLICLCELKTPIYYPKILNGTRLRARMKTNQSKNTT
jgi:hypothetical protein